MGAGGAGQGWGPPLQGRREAWGHSLPCTAAWELVPAGLQGLEGGARSPGTPTSPAPASAPGPELAHCPPSLSAAEGQAGEAASWLFCLRS